MPQRPRRPDGLKLEAWISEHKNDQDAEFIISGITNGFLIVDEDSQATPVATNTYRSATSDHTLVEKQILEELSEGRYVVTSDRPTIISAIGAVPKPDGNIRIVYMTAVDQQELRLMTTHQNRGR